jgi:quercetin dioxygenase-like cupin family protein
MIHLRGVDKKWTTERGYERGILAPYTEYEGVSVQVQLTEIAPMSYVPRHYHIRQTEFIYVISGSLVFVCGDKEIEVVAGDLLVLSPGDEHSTRNKTSHQAILVTFKLNGANDDTQWLEE